jgi:putative transcriptional regulator
MNTPDPADIRAAREAAGLSQEQAAAVVHLGNRMRWSEYERGARGMDPARWELFLIKVGRHPDYVATALFVTIEKQLHREALKTA